MAEYRICFSIAGEFGAELSFEVENDVPYEKVATTINKKKVAELLLLDHLGYTDADIEIITPEQYDAQFGDDNDG